MVGVGTDLKGSFSPLFPPLPPSLKMAEQYMGKKVK